MSKVKITAGWIPPKIDQNLEKRLKNPEVVSSNMQKAQYKISRRKVSLLSDFNAI